MRQLTSLRMLAMRISGGAEAKKTKVNYDADKYQAFINDRIAKTPANQNVFDFGLYNQMAVTKALNGNALASISEYIKQYLQEVCETGEISTGPFEQVLLGMVDSNAFARHLETYELKKGETFDEKTKMWWAEKIANRHLTMLNHTRRLHNDIRRKQCMMSTSPENWKKIEELMTFLKPKGIVEDACEHCQHDLEIEDDVEKQLVRKIADFTAEEKFESELPDLDDTTKEVERTPRPQKKKTSKIHKDRDQVQRDIVED